jgi:ribosomal protein S27AE
MEQMCPVCNGLLELNPPCPNCGSAMSDLGPMGDYAGPYSPYDEAKTIDSFQVCQHELYCPECGESEVLPIEQVQM